MIIKNYFFKTQLRVEKFRRRKRRNHLSKWSFTNTSIRVFFFVWCVSHILYKEKRRASQKTLKIKKKEVANWHVCKLILNDLKRFFLLELRVLMISSFSSSYDMIFNFLICVLTISIKKKKMRKDDDDIMMITWFLFLSYL
jgi:hypothetical protein